MAQLSFPLMRLPTELRQRIFNQIVPFCTISRRMAAAINSMPEDPTERFLAVQAYDRLKQSGMVAAEKKEYANFRALYHINRQTRAEMPFVEHVWLTERFPMNLAEFAAYMQDPRPAKLLSLALFPQDFVDDPGRWGCGDDLLPPGARKAAAPSGRNAYPMLYDTMTAYVEEWLRLLRRLPRDSSIGAVEIVATTAFFPHGEDDARHRIGKTGASVLARPFAGRVQTTAIYVARLPPHRCRIRSVYTVGGFNRESWALCDCAECCETPFGGPPRG